MRLYLLSARVGGRHERLLAMTRGPARAAVIVNSCDLMSDDDRTLRVLDEIAALEALGFAADELDLRDYFGDASRQRALDAKLNDYGLVWMRGGNSFVLRRAMKASGFDRLIRDRLARDAIVYAGYSAAIAVLVPSMRGLELVDDAVAVPPGYDAEPIWDGLGVLPYAVAPHYRSDHPESADIERVVAYYIDHHVPFVALRDGEGLVIDGNSLEIIG